MKTKKTQRVGNGLGLVLCTVAVVGTAAHAQPPPQKERPHRHGWEQRAEREPLREESHVKQWLETLQTEHPEEYERLMTLREAHPAFFRVELRRRVNEARALGRIRDEYPGFHEYLSGLDRDKRDELGHFLRQLADDGGPEGPNRSRHRRVRYPQLENSREIRSLIEQWRGAEDEAERSALEAAIREQLASIFDQRTRVQEEELASLEEQIERLRSLLESRRLQRDEWIERLLTRLLSREE